MSWLTEPLPFGQIEKLSVRNHFHVLQVGLRDFVFRFLAGLSRHSNPLVPVQVSGSVSSNSLTVVHGNRIRKPV